MQTLPVIDAAKGKIYLCTCSTSESKWIDLTVVLCPNIVTCAFQMKPGKVNIQKRARDEIQF